jgi:hypothetical protein
MWIYNIECMIDKDNGISCYQMKIMNEHQYTQINCVVIPNTKMLCHTVAFRKKVITTYYENMPVFNNITKEIS